MASMSVVCEFRARRGTSTSIDILIDAHCQKKCDLICTAAIIDTISNSNMEGFSQKLSNRGL